MNIDFTTIAQGTDSGYQSAGMTAIDNLEEWVDLWQLHTCNAEPPPPRPQVDFTHYSVVAVFAGEKPTGGYSVEILSVEIKNSRKRQQASISLSVQHHEPEAGELVTEAFTYPYQMIRIPKIDGVQARL